jgi:hypothetical protein
MKLREWLDKWSMTSLKINPPFLEMEWKPQDYDRNAAWELYIELLTRITTQYLHPDYGDEETALRSIYSLFGLTREVIKRQGRHCIEFTKIAVVILNQIIRPFTAKWHKLSIQKAFDDPEKCKVFRKELDNLQANLRIYAKMLADMAGVEDLTNLEAD